ncbi:MAG: hypothetical protein FWH01_08425 [Oscillospiraceae bacterium]|nr:hypothetical protein [Oscillospiraceae bacterium]
MFVMDQAMVSVRRFLEKHGMYPGDIDLEKICLAFESEMLKGLSSYKSDGSLLMLPTFIKASDTIPTDEPVIVIDAGGTNLRTAVLHFDKDMNCVMDEFNNYPMPGTGGEVSKAVFFETLYKYLDPILDRSDKIGFCFSYAVTIMPNRDGRVIELSKEVMVDGLVGEPVNENLLAVIRSHRPSSKHTIIQLNDTVATLLGGKAANPSRVFDSYIGLILGTGTNTCYIEDCANIKKLSEVELTPEQAAEYAPGNAMLINCESGSFDKAPFGDIDIALDKKMKDPGRYRYEKAMSGGYQGTLMTEILKVAADEGLFSPSACGRFAALTGLESRDLDNFLYYPYGDNPLARCAGTSGGSAGGAGSTGSAGSAEEDALKLFYLTDALFERVAIFTAAKVSSILRKTGKGKNPNLPVCVTADGSTFYRSKLVRSKLDHHIREFTNKQNGLYCDFIKAENGVLTGTAIAALQNS